MPQAPLRDQVAVVVVPPEARPLGHPVVVAEAVGVLTGVRAEVAAEVVVHHPVAEAPHRVVEAVEADINRSSPQVL